MFAFVSVCVLVVVFDSRICLVLVGFMLRLTYDWRLLVVFCLLCCCLRLTFVYCLILLVCVVFVVVLCLLICFVMLFCALLFVCFCLCGLCGCYYLCCFDLFV